MKKVNNKQIVIQGYMDGQPIWRYKTSNEILLEQIKSKNISQDTKNQAEYDAYLSKKINDNLKN